MIRNRKKTRFSTLLRVEDLDFLVHRGRRDVEKVDSAWLLALKLARKFDASLMLSI